MNVPVFHDYIARIEDVIEAARNGKMFILVDAEDRENEGDLVIPAQMCTPEAVNFMARYGRGLICLPVIGERLDQLSVGAMVQHSREARDAAFTVSVDAVKGVSTGVSAADRARTIRTLIQPRTKPEDLLELKSPSLLSCAYRLI